MKKRLAMLVVAVVAIVSLVVVGPAPEPVALAEGEEETAVIEAIGEITAELHNINQTLKGLIPEEEEKEKKGNIKWEGVSDSGGPMFESLQGMCDAILDASDGRLQLRVELAGGGKEAFDAVNEGDIDFAVVGLTWLVDKFPAAGLFCWRAGGMSPMEKYLWLISGGGAELFQEMIDDYNVYPVPGGGQMGTPEVFLHSSIEITSLDELAKLTIRAAGEGGAILENMGADVVEYMPGEDIYEAMTADPPMLDAFEYGSPWLNWEFNFQEVAEYVYLSECRAPHSYSPFLVNEDSWNELPNDLKVIVEKLAREEAIGSYAELCQCDIEALENFREYVCGGCLVEGCIVGRLPSAVEEEFLEKATECYDELADRLAEEEYPFFGEVLDSQRDFQETFRDTWPRP